MHSCNNKNNQSVKTKQRGFLSGLIYGLVPHIGCIAFIVFSILGVTTATAVFRPLLLSPYFFYILIALAVFFSTFSAGFYLRKNYLLSWPGIKRKKGYLLTLYGTTVGINLLFFMIIFPIAANISSGQGLRGAVAGTFNIGQDLNVSETEYQVSLQVDIPCPGHAPLITGELQQMSGVENVKFRFPNFFDVSYDPVKTSIEEIISLKIFNTYQAIIVK